MAPPVGWYVNGLLIKHLPLQHSNLDQWDYLRRSRQAGFFIVSRSLRSHRCDKVDTEIIALVWWDR
jgi:hypothetical protein